MHAARVDVKAKDNRDVIITLSSTQASDLLELSRLNISIPRLFSDTSSPTKENAKVLLGDIKTVLEPLF